MVKMMATVLSLLLPALVHATPTAKLDHGEIALGEPLVLSVSGPADALEGLDTEPLEQDFLIQGRTLSRSGGQGNLSLTLYPRHPGRITLPVLATPAGRTRPLTVQVADGSPDTPRVLVHVEMDPARPLARQATRLTLEACDDGSLNWERPILATHEGIALRPLGEQQFDVERDGAPCTAHRWHWALLPTAAGRVEFTSRSPGRPKNDLAPLGGGSGDLPEPGAQQLSLPWLKANKFGTQLRFPPPGASLDIQPLPGWLPPEAAIGRPQAIAAPLPDTWPLERPLAWRLEITGGYGVTEMKDLLRLQLAPYPALNAYPPMVEVLEPETRDSPLTRLAVTLYVLPQATGELVLPDLALPWFDPSSRQLENLPIPGPSLTVFDPLHKTLARWGLGLAGAVLLGLAVWLSYRSLAWRLARRRGLKVIAKAQNPTELAHALRGFSLRPHTPAAPTLGQWRAAMAREACCDGLDELVRGVELACYGPGRTADALTSQALDCLERARLKTIRPVKNVPI